MRDEEIVALYWRREEAAIRETEKKYGRYLTKIACQVLSDGEDARESVNDAYLRAWSSIPPHRPAALAAYLGRITRQLAIDRYRSRNRLKRRGPEYALALSELEACVSGGNTTEERAELGLLADAIAAYLRTRSPQERGVFLRRYYYMDPVGEIAEDLGMSRSGVKSMLYRLRGGLKTHLEQEGFSL